MRDNTEPDRQSTLSVGMLANTRPTPRPICCDRQSLVYRLTVCGVSVDYRWYRNIVNRCFAEIVAVSLNRGRERRACRLCSCVERAWMHLKLQPFRKHIGFWYDFALFLPHEWVFDF